MTRTNFWGDELTDGDRNGMDGYHATLAAIEATEHHWQQELPKRRVSIQFATERKRMYTGHVATLDRFYGDDDYWVEVVVDGFHTVHHGLIAAEAFLEGTYV